MVILNFFSTACGLFCPCHLRIGKWKMSRDDDKQDFAKWKQKEMSWRVRPKFCYGCVLVQDCQDNTEGDQCERCAPGFYGVVRGFSDDCKPCACPLLNPENKYGSPKWAVFSPYMFPANLTVSFVFSFSPTCVTEGFDDYRCTACPEGYEGKYCERSGSQICTMKNYYNDIYVSILSEGYILVLWSKHTNQDPYQDQCIRKDTGYTVLA